MPVLAYDVLVEPLFVFELSVCPWDRIKYSPEGKGKKTDAQRDARWTSPTNQGKHLYPSRHCSSNLPELTSPLLTLSASILDANVEQQAY